MTNETILDIVRRCRLKDGVELVPSEAYLFKRKFLIPIDNRKFFQECEIIVLVKNGTKVGGIYRMGNWDIHVVLNEKYRGQHILSNFFKKGIIEKIWPENKEVELCDVDSQETFDKKKYLASLCHLTIRNEEDLMDQAELFGWPSDEGYHIRFLENYPEYLARKRQRMFRHL